MIYSAIVVSDYLVGSFRSELAESCRERVVGLYSECISIPSPWQHALCYPPSVALLLREHGECRPFPLSACCQECNHRSPARHCPKVKATGGQLTLSSIPASELPTLTFSPVARHRPPPCISLHQRLRFHAMYWFYKGTTMHWRWLCTVSRVSITNMSCLSMWRLHFLVVHCALTGMGRELWSG